MDNNSTFSQDFKVIQEKGIGPLMRFMTNAAQSGNKTEMTPIQKRLYERKYGSAPKPDKITPIKQQTTKADALPSFTSGLETDILTVNGKQYDMRIPEQKKQMNADIDALQAKQQEIKTDNIPTGPRLDPNATEQYASNFKAGEANQDAMQDYFKGQKNGENLATWAAANPALAYKAYTKGVAKEKAQDQRDLMSDYRVMNQDVSKGEGFNKAKFDAIYGGKGGSVEVDIDGMGEETVRINPQAQEFKDTAQMSLINTLNNENITPIVEGMELPDMTKYAGIFNQTDAPDYKTMMENAAMGQLAENLGLPVNTYNTGNYFDRMFGK